MHRYSDRVFAIPDFLTKAESAELIALAETRGFEAALVRTQLGLKPMANVRNNQRLVCELPAWRERLWTRLAATELPVLDGGATAVGLPAQLRFYKYKPGQRFKMHKDGPWSEGGLASKLTLLVYLNDTFAGGATDFRDFIVRPATGMALLFIHDTWHEGEQVSSGTKYVLRSDVLYTTGDAAP
ncbi:putative 2-oxoglutarate/Fe(II)-dependent dioxygenase YbiX [Janthinobacterium sp. CG_23.3]|uniref:prolyl hydroxylase family protein n=1 Tax=Janthinobacterium sp. CG_23.3 TaxID=3349634 RepID=UPI0038D503F5